MHNCKFTVSCQWLFALSRAPGSFAMVRPLMNQRNVDKREEMSGSFELQSRFFEATAALTERNPGNSWGNRETPDRRYPNLQQCESRSRLPARQLFNKTVTHTPV